MNEDEDKTYEEAEDNSQAEWDEAFDDLAETGREDQEAEEDDTDDDAAGGEDTGGEEDASGDEVYRDTGRDEPEEHIRSAVDDVLPNKDDAAVQAVVQDLFQDDIPNPLVDSDGDPITSVSDMLQLVNPRTQQPFTYDEARAWMDEKKASYDAAVQERVTEASRVIENNTTIQRGVAKVQAEYGDLLKQMPEVAQQLIDTYQRTLEITPNGNVTKAPVDIVDFYNVSMKPYLDMAEKQEAAANKEKIKRTKSDRADVSGRSNTDNRTDSDKEWDTAFKEVLGG